MFGGASGPVVSSLSMEDLVQIIGHRDWKAIAIGKQRLMLLAFGAVDVEILLEKLAVKTGDAVTLDSQKSEEFADHKLVTYTIVFGDREYRIDNEHTGTENVLGAPVTAGNAFFMNTISVDGEKDIALLKVGDATRRQGCTADSKVHKQRGGPPGGGMFYRVVRVR
jgi:hypothetical protein